MATTTLHFFREHTKVVRFQHLAKGQGNLKPVEDLYLDKNTWAGMGRPQAVRVTVEPDVPQAAPHKEG